MDSLSELGAFLEGFAFHGSYVAIVVKKNLIAAKLAGNDPPARSREPEAPYDYTP